MSQSIQPRHTSDIGAINSDFYFKRTRLNQIFMEAMKYPLIIICAGAGYGKTTAVHDFLQEYKTTTVWVQLSERDNVGGRFWENFSHSMIYINNPPFAESIKNLGFPDTSEKLKQFLNFLKDHEDKNRRILVFDDCHYIESPDVIRFVEEAIRNLPIGTTLFLISRSTPMLGDLVSRTHIFNISEEELRFTENEVAQYFREQVISLKPDNLQKIMQDTEGWAFAINYIARSYKKAPGYEGYIRNAMKSNIFRFMNTELWDNISERLKLFLVRLSLIDHLSVDLISLLAENKKDLITELERQNAYVRRDSYINAYLIHPLFLEFLATKQELLSQEQKHETYTIAGEWCFKNGFNIDALSYYEKIGDYKAIVSMFLGEQSQIPYDISCYAADIFERTAPDVFDTIKFLASIHMRTVMCQGRWEDAIKLGEYYESRYIKLPEEDPFRRPTLSSIYYCWAIARINMCLKIDIYDFDLIFEKLSNCYSAPVDPGNIINTCLGPWSCVVGSSRKGALEEFIETFKRSNVHLSHSYINIEDGTYALSCGELAFYRNDVTGAESFLTRSMDRARERKRSCIVQRALFYKIRIFVSQGNFSRIQQLLKDMKALLDDSLYFNRFIDYDFTICWYYCIIGQPEKIPDWLKENFAIYADASFVENHANQMKARYCFATRNYPPLLSYIQDMKQRESFLYGRIEMLAIEACIHYKMKDKEKAYNTFADAYNASSPNNIIMPFIELGKDMRTLSIFALKKHGEKIPKSWLEDINRKSASYAKRLTHIITEYKKSSGITNNIAISPRESEILSDLSHGLSRTEIAASRNLSINTVKMLINNVYMKLGVESLAEAIRTATERKII